MSRAPKFILKKRTFGETTTDWETLGSFVSAEEPIGEVQAAFASAPPPKGTQHAVFHLGAIVKWWEDGKDITHRSRQEPVVSLHEGPTHHRFTLWNGRKKAASVVALDELVARRMVENSILHGDFEALEVRKESDERGPNRFEFLDAEAVPEPKETA